MELFLGSTSSITFLQPEKKEKSNMIKHNKENPWTEDNIQSHSLYTNEFVNDFSTFPAPVLKAAYKNGTVADLYHRHGVKNYPYETLISQVKDDFGGQMLRSNGDNSNHVFVFPWGCLYTESDGTIRIYTCDTSCLPPFVELATKWLAEEQEETANTVPVYGFSFEDGRYGIDRVGSLEDVLERGNYMPDVVEGFDYVLSELEKSEPRGRLVLVEGVPGTGKTRMIRALISALSEHSKCILVPPSLLDNLSGPDFTRCLIRNMAPDCPITLILEDADDCLIAREKNVAAKANLSALLNLSDGILGATMNLRVIATTNQELQAIDRAVLRKGRLLKRISVGFLSPEQATSVHRRLNPNSSVVYTAPTTLAEVYDAVQNDESK
jgi:hypothetical protein